MAQLDMFAADAPAEPTGRADPDRVRRKLGALLAEAKGPGLPRGRRRLMETVVPQMTRWLPDDEAEAIRQAFAEALAA
jgi:hypothetical protein